MIHEQEQTNNQEKNIWYYFASLVGIIIIFGFGSLPPIDPITPMGMKILGVFLGLIFLWSFVSTLWPSLLGIVALIILGYAPAPKVLAMSFGDMVPTLVLFAMILFGAIQHSGVIKHISRWCLTREIINGKPVTFSFIFLYTTYILAALSANILPALLFMWAILYGVLEEAGYKKGEKYTSIMVIGTLFAAISGQAAKPFTGSALVMGGAYAKASGVQLNYLQFMVTGFILSTLAIIAYTLLIKFVFRPDMKKIAGITIEQFKREALPPICLKQKIMLVALFGYLFIVLLPSFLSKSIPAVALLAKIGPLGVVMLFIVALLVVKVEGKPLLDFREVVGRYVIWDVYFFVCMAMAMATAMATSPTGITEFLASWLTPILGDRSWNMFSILLIICGITIIQFANNGIMGVLLMPVIKVFSDQAGGNFEAIATLAIFALHVAILTPASSPYAAVIYGNKKWISTKDIITYSIAICLMAMVVYTLIGVPLIHIIY